MKRLYPSLIGKSLFVGLTLSSLGFAKIQCPVMHDAFFSLVRANANLHRTRFPQAADIMASQLLVSRSANEIRSAMLAADCEFAVVSALPSLNLAADYKGDCPVIQSAINYAKRAVQDYGNVRPIFQEKVKHPRSSTQAVADVLAGFAVQQKCKP